MVDVEDQAVNISAAMAAAMTLLQFLLMRLPLAAAATGGDD